MGYEYKKSIKHDLETLNQLREVTDWRVDKEIGEKQTELDHVYAQAAKADEYEAKAKAFDVLYAEFDRDDMNLSKADFDEALEYESGESDA